MKLVQVDAIYAQVFKTFFAIKSETIRTSVQVSHIRRFFYNPALGPNEEPFRIRWRASAMSLSFQPGP